MVKKRQGKEKRERPRAKKSTTKHIECGLGTPEFLEIFAIYCKYFPKTSYYIISLEHIIVSSSSHKCKVGFVDAI